MPQAGSRRKNKRTEHTLLLASEVLAGILLLVSISTLRSVNESHRGSRHYNCHCAEMTWRLRGGGCLSSDRERAEISRPPLTTSTQSVLLPALLSKLPPLATRAPHRPVGAHRVVPSRWCSLPVTLHTAHYS